MLYVYTLNVHLKYINLLLWKLEKKNYLIFRMGKNVEKKLSYTSENVIDYAKYLVWSILKGTQMFNRTSFRSDSWKKINSGK